MAYQGGFVSFGQWAQSATLAPTAFDGADADIVFRRIVLQPFDIQGFAVVLTNADVVSTVSLVFTLTVRPTIDTSPSNSTNARTVGTITVAAAATKGSVYINDGTKSSTGTGGLSNTATNAGEELCITLTTAAAGGSKSADGFCDVWGTAFRSGPGGIASTSKTVASNGVGSVVRVSA